MNHYETLGVARDADEATIKSAYRSLRSKHHPDRDHGDTDKMKAVQIAYDTLSDEDKRAAYDSKLAADEKQECPIESIATEALVAMFANYIANGGDENPLDRIKTIVKGEKDKCTAKIAGTRQLIKTIEIKSKLVKKKSRGIDIYQHTCETGIEVALEDIKSVERHLAIHNKVLEMVDDYAFLGSTVSAFKANPIFTGMLGT